MKRGMATERLEAMILRLVETEWPLSLITDVYVFGSYARGALEVGDIDVDIEHETTQEWARYFVTAMTRGQDAYAKFRIALRGRSRGLSLVFNGRAEMPDVPMILLWTWGESVDDALARLRGISEDADAGRAPRDDMTPAFGGYEDVLPRDLRAALIELQEAGAITLECLTLPKAQEVPRAVAGRVKGRWKDDSPLLSSAVAALIDCSSRGVDLRRVWLHGEPLGQLKPHYFIALGLGDRRCVARYLASPHAKEWIQVLDPSRSRQLRTLRVVASDRATLVRIATRHPYWAPL